MGLYRGVPMSESKPEPIGKWSAGRFTVYYWGLFSDSLYHGTTIDGPGVLYTNTGILLPGYATSEELMGIAQALEAIASLLPDTEPKSKPKAKAKAKPKAEPTVHLSYEDVGHRIQGVFATTPPRSRQSTSKRPRPRKG